MSRSWWIEFALWLGILTVISFYSGDWAMAFVGVSMGVALFVRLIARSWEES